MRYTPEELKRRYNQTEAWKNLKPEIKEELRASWKELDSICIHQQGRLRLVQSKLNPDIFIKGCVFHENEHVDNRPFITMVKGVEQQLKKRDTDYAVHSYGVEDLIYETNSDWHHIELGRRTDWENDSFAVSLTSRQRIYRNSVHSRHDGDYNENSYIEDYLLQLRRMWKTRKEHYVKEMIALSNQVLRTGPEELTGDGILIHRMTGNQLASKVKDYFE